MSRLVAVVVTAAVCLPVGALLRRDASADPRKTNDLVVAPIVDHPHLHHALAALHEALDELDESRQDDEPLWSDQTGRAAALRTSMVDATHAFDQTADWVREGMRRSSPSGLDAAMPGAVGTRRGIVFVPWMHP